MEQNLIYMLNSLKFQEAVRDIFGAVNKFLYFCIAKLIDGMYEIASLKFGLEDQIDEFTSRFFVVLVIFMIFKLTLSVMNYLIDPDSFSDKSKGGGKLISRVIITVALLISINPIFKLLSDVQDTIINDNVVTNLILGDDLSVTHNYEVNGQKLYSTRISNDCKQNYSIISYSKGDKFSVLALRPFYQLATDVDDSKEQVDVMYGDDDKKDGTDGVSYCGYNTDNLLAQTGTQSTIATEVSDKIKSTPNSASELLTHKIFNSISGDWDVFHEEDFDVEFNYIWALVVGIVLVLIIISFCFDIVVRAFTLFFYQLLAPIPIVSYISPKGKDSEMLGNWFKKVISVWGSLFIRIGILDFVIYFIGVACNEIMAKQQDTGLVIQIVILIGMLMFAKKLPKLLEELIPGLKLDGGFELNPFKKISKDALGGNLALAGGAALAAAGMSGAANAYTGLEKNLTGENKPGFNWNKGKSLKENLKGNVGAVGRLARGTVKTGGSIIAGQASAGSRAFMKTSKDGRMFTGIKEGHLESQFAKQQREDLVRKGSTLGGRVAADANRWIGRMNAGQRQQLDAANQDILIANDLDALRLRKLEMQTQKSYIDEQMKINKAEKDEATETYRELKENFDAMNKRIDSRKAVKDELDRLEWLKNTDFSNEVEGRVNMVNDIKARYSTRLQNATNNLEIENIKSQMEAEIKSVGSLTADGIKNERIEAQNKLINEKRLEYFTDVENGKIDDEILASNIQAIKEIRKNNAEIAANKDFDFLDEKGKYNKAAVYKAEDKVNIISKTFNDKEADYNKQLYAINIEEQKIAAEERTINAYKQTDEYVETHNKESKAMADNASRKVAKGGQPEGWLPSGDVNAGGTTGYGGNQYYTNGGSNGGPGPGPHGGPPPGGHH